MLKALRNQLYQESRDHRIEEYGNMFIKCEMFRISHAESLKFSDKMSKDMLMHSKLTTESIRVTFHQILKPYLTAVWGIMVWVLQNIVMRIHFNSRSS